jgi:predicted 3-demethylubiquinone-9 3-methyltransferase (glyoxalase superfamily)
MKSILTTLAPVLLAMPFLAPPHADPGAASTPAAGMQKITPFLWFDDDAEEAIRFYCTLFPDSTMLSESRWGAGGPVPAGTLMSARFRLAGQELMALNGGPTHRLDEAFSMYVNCETQAEIDSLWEKLVADGGEPSRCGWLKDRFGLSWQLIPSCLPAMLSDPDPARAGRVGQAMMSMQKLDIAKLKAAHGR